MDGRDRVLPGGNETMISVVVCTHNPNERYLSRTVDSILGQTFPKSETDFFIVDNNSSKPVADLDVVRKNGINVVEEKRPGLTAARECGAREARGELVVFVDDDNILDPSYLFKADQIFSDEKIGIMSGVIVPEYEQLPASWFYIHESMLAIRRFPENHYFVTTNPEFNDQFPIGAGICIRKRILIEYFSSLDSENRIEGRMGTSLSSGEDIDIDMFAISTGYTIGSSGNLKLVHIIPSGRCTVNYLQRLAVSSLCSSYKINEKWKPVFKQDIFTFFSESKSRVMLKILFYAMTRWNKNSRILLSFHKTLFLMLNAKPLTKSNA
jgi:glycosyltransferase involved in cell wall biosynthesis